MATITLSSPNRVVWEYFFSLRQLAASARAAPGAELCRQATALTIIMAVTAGEVFLNLWFRARVEERCTTLDRDAFLRDLSPPFLSLEKKLKRWPSRYLAKPLDLSSGAGKAFVDLKNKRNAIVHFTSTHESFSHDGIAFHGLANTTDYDELSYEAAAWALETAECFVAEILRLAEMPPDHVRHAMHAWTGKVSG